MSSNNHRLDRFISKTLGIPKGQVRLMLAQKRIVIDGNHAQSIHQPVNQFSDICIDGIAIQKNKPIYLMMHKPVGILSATKDPEHKTVIDLLHEYRYSESCILHLDKTDDLHVVGRLDLNSSGLLLITNDSNWSSKLMRPTQKVPKRYLVRVEKPISDECIKAFNEGIFFAYENKITQPASLLKITETEAVVILTEGKYHQIKRMFGQFRNQVLGLHRTQIGEINLDPNLAPGEFRYLTTREIIIVT